jgi:dethiobiotin synthetase
MKPVAAGADLIDGVWHNDDADALMAAADVPAQPHLVMPYAFAPPIAPHIAAAAADVAIDPHVIVAAYAQLAAQADRVVVEGVGGFCVPLGATFDSADLARALDLPLLLVVGMRLGCLNHALLTAEAIARRGLRLTGWVANVQDAAMPALDANIAALDARLPAPRLNILPQQIAPDATIAVSFDTQRLDALLQRAD